MAISNSPSPSLFVQALLGVKGIYDAKRVTICLLGKPATGNFKRPFTSQGIMAEKHVGAKKEEQSLPLH
ncbi:hypothetical protein Agabi119p4_3279 [Agaricus bisporus var. burnettii]|uniref:Uncharacterized protein n=1 Tax=Agaricus bisporus var. burnettii TaxID=192524 RepID=A0A8H7F6Z1_AGABI|nr:hypothetical protein Agabi119p4_3279 [Agaricus bisporus var. burnettii]